MNEFKIDNPAARLLAILVKGSQHPLTGNCRETWKKILDVNSDEFSLISRLAAVMELPANILQIIDENFQDFGSKSKHWKVQINKAFTSQNLNSDWRSFYSDITAQTISELELLTELFKRQGHFGVINKDELQDLLNKIIELKDEIRNATLSHRLKIQLMRQLSYMESALELYDISGLDPVVNAIHSTFGLYATDVDFREEFIENRTLYEKFSKVVGDLANMVTVAEALPALPAALHIALECFNK